MTLSAQTILVGDIGGTNVRFGLAVQDGKGRWSVDNFAKYPGDDFPALELAIEKYMGSVSDTPDAMSLAIAGPIENGAVTLTNREWSVSEKGLSAQFGIERVQFYNDFAAMARAVPELPPEAFTVLRGGDARAESPLLVAGAGTGFGVAYIIPSSTGWTTLATEGGHMAYAARTPDEMAVRQLIERDYGYASVELICSGSGLVKVHKAVCERRGEMFKSQTPDQIRERASAGDPLYLEICHIRARAIMGALGDLALAGGARGGIVLAGGVSERMVDFLMKDNAESVFADRGPRTDYVRALPIRLMTDPSAPLIGAAALLGDSVSHT